MTIQIAGPELVSIVERRPEPAVILEIEGPVADLPRLMSEAFARTAAAIGATGGATVGPPFARYLEFGPRVRAEVGFRFRGPVTPAEPLRIVELPGGPAVTTTHIGPYDAIGDAWDRTSDWVAERGLRASGPPWEVYLNGPDEPGPRITAIFWPIG
jgi:effector-binding domain-containing protein